MSFVDTVREEVAPDSSHFLVTSENRVAVTLYCLKDQGSFSQIENSFGASRATVSIHNVHQGINPILSFLPTTLKSAKVIKFLVKIFQFKFLVIREKKIFVYQLFLSLNISHFSLFFM